MCGVGMQSQTGKQQTHDQPHGRSVLGIHRTLHICKRRLCRQRAHPHTARCAHAQPRIGCIARLLGKRARRRSGAWRRRRARKGTTLAQRLFASSSLGAVALVLLDLRPHTFFRGNLLV